MECGVDGTYQLYVSHAWAIDGSMHASISERASECSVVGELWLLVLEWARSRGEDKIKAKRQVGREQSRMVSCVQAGMAVSLHGKGRGRPVVARPSSIVVVLRGHARRVHAAMHVSVDD